MKEITDRIGNLLLVAAILVAAAAASITTAHAQEIPGQIKKLYPFVGTWVGNAKMTMGGETITFKLKHVTTKVSDGYGLQTVESAVIPGLGSYHSVNLWGYDPGKDMIHLFSVTNSGETHDHSAVLANDGTMTLRYEGVADGKPYVEVIPMKLTSPKEYHFTSTVTIGGQTEAVLDVTMKRQ